MIATNTCEDCDVNSSCVFFKSGLSKDEKLEDCLITIHLKKGQPLFEEGDKKKGVFFVKEGKLKCLKTDNQGKSIILGFVLAGEGIGYSMVYNDSEIQEISVHCLEDANICFLPYHIAQHKIRNNFVLLNMVANILNDYVLGLSRIIVNYNTKNVRERVANSILFLKKRVGLDSDGFINIALTREEIAQMSATTIESSIRYISEFQKDGIILVENRRIKILDNFLFERLLGNTY